MEFFPTSESILAMKSLDFRIAYAYYKMNKSLEEQHRVKIAKSIIYDVFENNVDRKLDKKDLIHLANLIVEIFPTEVVGTFFTPAIGKTTATGKLFCGYRNIQTAMAQVGLISRETRNRTKNPVNMNSTFNNFTKLASKRKSSSEENEPISKKQKPIQKPKDDPIAEVFIKAEKSSSSNVSATSESESSSSSEKSRYKKRKISKRNSHKRKKSQRKPPNKEMDSFQRKVDSKLDYMEGLIQKLIKSQSSK